MNREALRVHIEFWGEKQAATLVPGPTGLQQYNVRCPPDLFAAYLRDMRHNLRIELEGIGRVRFDISQYLHPNVCEMSTTIFDHLKKSFEVVGIKDRKVGVMEIQMAANFHPQKPIENALLKQFYGEIENDKVMKKEQIKGQEKQEKKTFPQINKVLTYSNLMLRTPMEQIKDQDDIIENPLQKIITSPIHQMLPERLSPQRNKSSIKQNNIQIMPNVIDNQFRPHYLADSNLLDSNMVEKQFKEIIREQQNKQAVQKLSRVVNLREQMIKQLQDSPKKSKIFEIKKQYDAKKYAQEDFQKNNLKRQVIINENNIIRNNRVLTYNQQNKISPTFQNVPSHMNRPVSSKQLQPQIPLLVLIQIPTKSIKTPCSFVITHRLQGEKVSLSPPFGSKISILSPISSKQIKNQALLIEFWALSDRSFIGVLRISLHNVRKGLLLEGRINNTVVKTSVTPFITHRGVIQIVDLHGGRKGQCFLQAAIGTAAQIQKQINYAQNQNIIQIRKPTNQPTKQQIKQPTKQLAKEIDMKYPQQKHEITNSQLNDTYTIMDLTDLLELIDVKNQELIPLLIALGKQINVLKPKFQQFLNKIGYKTDIIKWLYINQFKQKQIPYIQPQELSKCFKDFKLAKDQYRIQFINYSKMIKKIIDIELFLKQVQQKSVFNAIIKAALKQSFYKALTVRNENSTKIVNSYVQFFTQISNVGLIINSLKQKAVPPMKNTTQYSKQILSKLFLNKTKSPQKLFQLFSKPLISAIDFKNNYPQMSIWLIRNVFDLIRIHFKQQISDQVQLSMLYNWMKLKLGNQKNNSNLQHPSLLLEQIVKDYSQLQFVNKQSQIQNKHQSSQFKQKQQQISQRKLTPQQSNIDSSIHKPNKNIDPQENNLSNISLSQPKQIEQALQQILPYKHTFTIQILQLQLLNPKPQTCQLAYAFPHEQQTITSKPLIIMPNKTKYKVNCCSCHSFTLTQKNELQKYFGDSYLHFTLNQSNKIYLQGDLPAQQLCTSQEKIIPLFREEGMSGRLRVRISYEGKQAQDTELGKETKYQVYLPKRGFINYIITMDTSKVRNQLSYRDYYYALNVDIFGENKELKKSFKGLRSVMQTPDTRILMDGNIKVSLTSSVLQYIKNKHCVVSLVVIYYARGANNFQRKESLIAQCKLPLLGLIRGGINGNYALNNRLGIFVAPFQCKLTYEQQPKMETKINVMSKGIPQSESYIVLKFIELINFQAVQPHSFKARFVYQGKQYSTENILLHSRTYHHLSQSISMQLTAQEYALCHLIPLTLITPAKYAVDINMKALLSASAATKALYFTVLDQKGKSTKMRLGIRVCTFRHHSQYIQYMSKIQFNQTKNNKIENIKNRIKINTKNQIKTLSEQFYNDQIYSNLSLTPIFTQNSIQIQQLCQLLPTQVNAEQLLQFLKEKKIILGNFRSQFLNRFTFKSLNRDRIDRNVEYLNLEQHIDLMTFVRKIQIQQHQQQQCQAYEIQLIISKGKDFHKLYNGVAPNSLVRIFSLGFQTAVVSRATHPVFDQNCTFPYRKQLKKLKIQVLHYPRNSEQGLIIGEGSITLQLQRQQYEENIVIHSTMSAKMSAIMTVNIKINVGQRISNAPRSNNNYQHSIQEGSYISQNREQIQQAIGRINKSMKQNEYLFNSSDDSY